MLDPNNKRINSIDQSRTGESAMDCLHNRVEIVSNACRIMSNLRLLVHGYVLPRRTYVLFVLLPTKSNALADVPSRPLLTSRKSFLLDMPMSKGCTCGYGILVIYNFCRNLVELVSNHVEVALVVTRCLSLLVQLAHVQYMKILP